MKSTASKPMRTTKTAPEGMRLRIRLKERQVDGLIRKGYLRREDREDGRALAEAARAFLEHTLRGDGLKTQ